MARIARVVVPGYPHHVTQRGSRRQTTFFQEEDYQTYLSLMARWCRHYGVSVWAYCLMPNHIHLIAVPETSNGLSRAVAQTHQTYARLINKREGWIGHLWQERFASFVMDESYLLAAVRYVELNPVRAGLVAEPEEYQWSSAKAHLAGTNDVLLNSKPMMDRIPDWRDFLCCSQDDDVTDVRIHTKTGRPLGCHEFVVGLEKVLGRPLKPLKRGRKKKRDSSLF